MKGIQIIRCLLLMTCLGLWLSPTGAWAHTDNSEGYSKITADTSVLHYELFLDYFELGRVVNLEMDPSASQKQRIDTLEANKQQAGGYVNSHLEMYIDGMKVEGQVVRTEVEQKLDRDYAHLFIDYPNTGNSQALEVHYNIFFDDNDPMHRNIATYEWDGKEGQFVFHSGDREFLNGKAQLFSQILRFIQLGFHHIMIGYDHILFVIALVLSANKAKDVLKVVTVFTLAHSVTLGLSAFHVLSIPSQIVEPLIALSIAYVALEIIFGQNTKFRLGIVFAFGLIHGIGFAGALELTGKMTGSALLSLASFNIGVESGQALIICLLFPIIAYVRRYKWSGMLQGITTAGILGFGLIWYFERLLS